MPLAGRPLAAYALEAFRACAEIDEIVLVVGPADVERARRTLLRPAAAAGAKTERVVAGGEARQASVRAGLAEVSPSCDLVLVHDAARPFVQQGLIHRCLQAAREHEAVIAAVPTADTVKEVRWDGVVVRTPDRAGLWLVQTPQVYRRQLLVEAHEAAAREGFAGTDDASLVERIGHRVHVVLGDRSNIKITWPEDLERAEKHLSITEDIMAKEVRYRSGIGYDAHRFETGRPLVLAGVLFSGETGLGGHSDADVVCHAICDALLGAAGAGDIGGRFPDTDERYRDVSSLSLLSRTADLIGGLGWEIENVDAVVIAEAPRIAPRTADMRRALAEALALDVERVSIKGKTTEGMGFSGRREGIASQAVALLRAQHMAAHTREERKC